MTNSTLRPPRRWEIQTWGLLGLALASALAGLVTLVTLLGVRNVIATRGSSGTSVLTEFTLRHADQFDQIYFILVLAYLAAFYWWRAESKRLLTMFGDSQAKALRHWTIAAWNVLIPISFLIRFVGSGSRDGADTVAVQAALSQLDTTITGLAVRLIALLLLVVGVWLVRGQVRAAIATSFSNPPSAPAPVAAPVEHLPPSILDTTKLPPADDAYWARVRDLSYAAGADLALLESTSNLIRRWSLIPSASAVEQIRASLPPGTVITVFPSSPQPGSTAPSAPPSSNSTAEWFGLTEDARTGMLWFQLLLPSRVPAWLAKAQSAHRYGLYRSDDPAALTAVIPTPAQISAVGSTPATTPATTATRPETSAG